jgi:hypothetical protein
LFSQVFCHRDEELAQLPFPNWSEEQSLGAVVGDEVGYLRREWILRMGHPGGLEEENDKMIAFYNVQILEKVNMFIKGMSLRFGDLGMSGLNYGKAREDPGVPVLV